MANRVTRIDVELGTDRARQQMRELREEAARNGVSTTGITGTVDTQGRERLPSNIEENVRDVFDKIARENNRRISREFEQARKDSEQEFRQTRRDYGAGRITQDEFDKSHQDYRNHMDQLDDDEQRERLEFEKQQSERLADILEELRGSRQENTQTEQQSSGGNGILKGLFEKRGKLRQEQFDAETEEEIKQKGKELEQVDKDIQKYLGKGSSLMTNVSRAGDIGGSIMSGNLSGAGSTAMEVISALGGTAAVIVGVVGAVAAVFGTAFMRGQKLEEEAGDLYTFRSQGNKSDLLSNIINSGIENYGLRADEFMKKEVELARRSGSSSNLTSRTFDAVALEKGYGIQNVAQYSALERQDKYGRTTNENLVEMLNVLSQIRDGSISPADLTLVNEKAATMFRLQNLQVSRQENFDNKQVLSMMSAFEKLGGSGKDQRQGDFIENFVNAGREGSGNKNIELLKFEAAKKAFPNLANDPYALSTVVENGTDPQYIKSFYETLRKASGGNEQNFSFLKKDVYKGLTPEQRKMIDNLDFDILTGKNYNPNGGTFSQQQANEQAIANTTLTKDLGSTVGKHVDKFSVAVNDFANTVNDMGENVKTGQLPQINLPKNTVHK